MRWCSSSCTGRSNASAAAAASCSSAAAAARRPATSSAAWCGRLQVRAGSAAAETSSLPRLVGAERVPAVANVFWWLGLRVSEHRVPGAALARQGIRILLLRRGARCPLLLRAPCARHGGAPAAVAPSSSASVPPVGEQLALGLCPAAAGPRLGVRLPRLLLLLLLVDVVHHRLLVPAWRLEHRRHLAAPERALGAVERHGHEVVHRKRHADSRQGAAATRPLRGQKERPPETLIVWSLLEGNARLRTLEGLCRRPSISQSQAHFAPCWKRDVAFMVAESREQFSHGAEVAAVWAQRAGGEERSARWRE